MFLPVFDSHLWMCKNDVFIWLNIFCNSIIVWDQTRLLTLREYHPKMMMMNPLLVDENVFKGDFVTIFKSSVSIVQSYKWQKLTNPLLAFLMIWRAIFLYQWWQYPINKTSLFDNFSFLDTLTHPQAVLVWELASIQNFKLFPASNWIFIIFFLSWF